MKNKVKYKFHPLIWAYIVFVYLIIVTWNKWGDVISFDTSREILVPYLITKGLKLYNDIEYNYGPLIPYFFAFLISVFGLKLKVFYAVGILNVLVYSLVLYKISREYLNKVQSSLVCCLFFSQLVFFNAGMFSYIYPYSYAAVISGTILAINCYILILFIKNPNKTWLLKGTVFAVSLLFIIKQDFFITGILSIIVTFILLALPRVNKLKATWNNYSILKFLTSYLQEFLSYIPCISCFKTIITIFCLCLAAFCLMCVYFNPENIYTSFFALDLFHQSYVKIFLEKECKSTLNLQNLSELAYFSILNMATVIVSIASIYLALKNIKNIQNVKKLIIFVLIGLLILLLSFILKIGANSILVIMICNIISYSKNFYSGINLWIALFILIITLRSRFNKDISVLFLLLTALISNLRMFFNMELELYSFYYLPFSIIIFVYFVTKFLPKYFLAKYKFNSKLCLKSSYIFLTSTMIIFLIISTGVYARKNIQISTILGKSYINDYNYLTYLNYKKMESFLKANSERSNTVLFYPTANLMYIISDRLPGSKYFNLLPATIFSKNQESESIQEIIDHKPKYIFILSDSYDLYNLPYFGCTNYNHNLMASIKANYQKVGSIESSLYNETKKVLIYRQF